MKLNNECIRDILFIVEEMTGFNKDLRYPGESSKCKRLSNYEKEEVLYHILQCGKAGLIECKRIGMSETFFINDLTPRGHKLIGNIREDNNWNKVKNIANKIGATSLEAIEKIASEVISNVIIAQMNLGK